MKNFKILCAAFSTVLAIQIAAAQDQEKPLDNGFHLLLHTSFQSNPSTDFVDDSPTLYGIDIGNTWNFYKLESIPLAVGIRVSWLDVAFGVAEPLDDVTNHRLMASAFTFGPSVTYKVKDELGVEASFRLKPTFYYDDFQVEGGGDTSAYGFGLTNAFGLSVRYNVLSLGVEFGGGTISGSSDIPGSSDSIDIDIPTKHTRIAFGLRF